MCGGGNEVEDEDQENKYGWYFIARMKLNSNTVHVRGSNEVWNLTASTEYRIRALKSPCYWWTLVAREIRCAYIKLSFACDV